MGGVHVVALIALSAVAISCGLLRDQRCVELGAAECEEAIRVALGAIEDGGHWVVVTADRQLPDECVRLLPGGGESHIDPCPADSYDLVAQVTITLEDGRRVEQTVVRQAPGEPMRIGGPFY
jgi:hypothetical protein